MKKFTEILLEKNITKLKNITDLENGDYVKRKKDGKISKIEGITITIFFGKKNKLYYVNFDNNIEGEEYPKDELELPTPKEIEFYDDIKKYNL